MSTPFYDLASLVLVPSGYKAQKVYAQKPLTTDGQLTFSRASTATRVNSAGLIETVSSNVPRLDYLGSTCPKLNLEPQRTNVVTYSEQLDNAIWTKAAAGTGTAPIVTANYGVSPDGNQNADRVQFARTGSGYSLLDRNTASVGASVVSFYGKSLSGTQVIHLYFGSAGQDFTLTTEWQRFTLYSPTSSSDLTIGTRAGGGGIYDGGNLNIDCLLWGFQKEEGAYATSYIPTTTAAVTRSRDDLAKSGISTLIGQTAGTVFVEFEFSGSKDSFWPVMTVMGAGAGELIEVYGSAGSNSLNIVMVDNGVTQFSQGRTLTVGRHKLAIAYELNNTVAYLDGTIMGTVDTPCTIPTMTQIGIGEFAYSSAYTFGDRINQAMLFKTRLTNAQLAELTTL